MEIEEFIGQEDILSNARKGWGGLGIRTVVTFNEHYFSDKLLGCIVILNYY